MNNDKFSKYTEIIRKYLPFWFKIKKKPQESLGLLFLKIFGMQLDDIDKILNYAYEQTKISSIDTTFCDRLYALDLESNFIIEDIRLIKTGQSIIRETKTLYELLNLEEKYKISDNINQPNYYFIDKDRKIIYFTEPYNKNNKSPYGKVTVTYVIGKDEIEKTYNLRFHQLWNFLDEFGALLCCPRIKEESNLSYKERIMDVFRHPASSTKLGLVNGISRELNLRKRVVWNNNCNYEIKDKMVLLDSIMVDKRNVGINELRFTKDDNIILDTGLKQSEIAIVSYIKGLEVTSFTDKSNKISNELLLSNGDQTDLMHNYIKILKQNSSFMWGDFNYNEGIWIINADEYNSEHFSFKPSRFDARINGFKNYKKCKGEY